METLGSHILGEICCLQFEGSLLQKLLVLFYCKIRPNNNTYDKDWIRSRDLEIIQNSEYLESFLKYLIIFYALLRICR